MSDSRANVQHELRQELFMTNGTVATVQSATRGSSHARLAPVRHRLPTRDPLSRQTLRRRMDQDQTGLSAGRTTRVLRPCRSRRRTGVLPGHMEGVGPPPPTLHNALDCSSLGRSASVLFKAACASAKRTDCFEGQGEEEEEEHTEGQPCRPMAT
eukprot:2641065-Rhodomonas_salina.4